MTEKNYNPKQKERKAMEKPKEIKIKPQEVPKKETKKEKAPEKKLTKPKEKEIKKIKKSEAKVDIRNIPISTKYSVEICRFIKNKPIDEAIKELNEVLLYSRAIPMRGEYGHKKGKNMAGGKYPKKATEYFIKALKSLKSNSILNGLEEPIIISKAMANLSSRPMGRFGRWKRKRTHLKIIAKKGGKK